MESLENARAATLLYQVKWNREPSANLSAAGGREVERKPDSDAKCERRDARNRDCDDRRRRGRRYESWSVSDARGSYEVLEQRMAKRSSPGALAGSPRYDWDIRLVLLPT